MKPKGFLPRRENRQAASTATKSMLYVGIIIMFCALIFMTFNLDEADTGIYFWLTFMIAGIVLVYISFLRRKRTKKRPEDPTE